MTALSKEDYAFLQQVMIESMRILEERNMESQKPEDGLVSFYSLRGFPDSINFLYSLCRKECRGNPKDFEQCFLFLPVK